MKKLFTFLLATGISAFAFGQTAPAIQWQKTYGGTGGELATATQQTRDGGYIVAGYAESQDGDVTGNHGSFDIWVVKLDDKGTLQWQKSLGGTGSDAAQAVRQTSDGGYIVAGYSNSNNGDVTGNHGNFDYWVIKLDSAGVLQWQKSLGGSGEDRAYAIQQTSDGGYIVGGSAASTNGDVTGNHGIADYWIVKLDAAGALQWQKSFGGSAIDEAHTIQQTRDGGYIVAGRSESFGGDVTGNHGTSDCWVIKLDGGGVLQWQKTFGGSNFDAAASIQQTNDGGYIMSGRTLSADGDISGNHGSYDCWVVKMNDIGALQWQKSLGGTKEEFANTIQQTSDGGYIVAGHAESSDGDVTSNYGSYDFWVVKLDSGGALQWQKSLGGAGTEEVRSIEQTSDGGYIMAGTTTSTNGDVTGNHGYSDYWVVRLAGRLTAVSSAAFADGFFLFPNPATDVVHFQSSAPLQAVRITDLNGREVYRAGVLTTENVSISTASFARGFYLLYAATAQGTVMQKFEVW